MANNMTDFHRHELLKRLSTMPAQTILSHLQEDAILDIAAKCFQDVKEENKTSYQDVPLFLPSFDIQQHSPGKKNTGRQAADRAKRPLNAFIAFRSFYLKLFPASQQKAASGFLTTLWHKDPYRHRWALIAKVYSFVRDEMGKVKVPLSTFLEAACPAMGILHPDDYLQVLGWAVEDTENDTKRLVQRDELRVPKPNTEPNKKCPDSELELLQEMISLGYMPSENIYLVEALLARNKRSALTSTISIAEHMAIKAKQNEKQEKKTQTLPDLTSQGLPPTHDFVAYLPSPEASTAHGGTSPCADNITSPPTCDSMRTSPIPMAPVATPSSTPPQSFALPPIVPVCSPEPSAAAAAAAAGSYFRPYYYHFAPDDNMACSPASSFSGDNGGSGPTSHPALNATAPSPTVLSFDGVADHQAFDIDCPWDIDAVLSQCTQPSGQERIFVLSNGPDYDPHEDFHYTF